MINLWGGLYCTIPLRLTHACQISILNKPFSGSSLRCVLIIRGWATSKSPAQPTGFHADARKATAERKPIGDFKVT
ncbi:hypothetical protein B0T16DRAFT_407531 [Cercophora newfieldiana]|uniref:Uncharacterized protein n=1 Tax=Cercophora newfieldiana TaxID=92897 RepID=A0AA39YID5_9PEZI|nr:hypothetical protein B0T16DRAFT_407531 [Cercophora newfieldiana]